MKYEKLLVNCAKDLFLLNVNIENVSEIIKILPLLGLHIPMIYMKLYSKRMDQLFGNIGDQNLNLLINAQKLMAVLITG